MGKKIISKICKCGITFSSYISHNRNYCSRNCYHKYRIYIGKKNRKFFICKQCNLNIEDCVSTKRVFCSKECKNLFQSINHRGNNNPNYKLKKDKINFKSNIKWSEWRTLVFKRDNFTCQFCFKNKVSLEPHHLKSKQCFPKLVYDINNGITLCKKCHRLLHKLRPANDIIKIEEYPLSILENYKISLKR